MPTIFQIGEFSKLSKTPIKTLRYYDDCGILKPNSINRVTNYRYYSTNQIATLDKIRSLQAAGFSLSEIREVLHGVESDRILQKKIDVLTKELAAIQQQISTLSLLQSGETKRDRYSAVVKTIPEYCVLLKKGQVKDDTELLALIQKIGEKRFFENLAHEYLDYCFAVFPDDIYTAKNICYEFYQAVESSGTETDNCKILPSEMVVSVLSKGSYHDLCRANVFLYEWMEENGYVAAGLVRERYIKGGWNCESEEEWLTEIQIPIKKE